jgi:hypothetical protein
MVSELVNPAAVIERNLDKTYQRQLETAGVPIIPTTWVMPGDVWQPPDTAEFVIKPSVSAGGRNTARYSGGDTAALQHVRALQRAGQTVMVQEYLSAIDEDGEVDLVFFDGTFSHAVVKRPALRPGRVSSSDRGSVWRGLAWRFPALSNSRSRSRRWASSLTSWGNDLFMAESISSPGPRATRLCSKWN